MCNKLPTGCILVVFLYISKVAERLCHFAVKALFLEEFLSLVGLLNSSEVEGSRFVTFSDLSQLNTILLQTDSM